MPGELSAATLAALGQESGRKHRNAGIARRRKFKQSAKRRASKLAYYRRTKKANPEKINAPARAANQSWRDRKKKAQADRREARLRLELARQGLFVVTTGQLQRPLLKRSDGSRLTPDDERTAEQVIADWLKTQKLPGALQ